MRIGVGRDSFEPQFDALNGVVRRAIEQRDVGSLGHQFRGDEDLPLTRRTGGAGIRGREHQTRAEYRNDEDQTIP